MAGHFRRYAVASLSRALLGYGFHIEFASYMFAPLVPPIFLLRTVPPLFGLPGDTGNRRDEAGHDLSGLATRIIGSLLTWQFRRLDAGRSIWFGASCVCLAVGV